MATPSTRSKTFMTSLSTSSSPYQPFDYLGCSNCADDFIENHSENPPSFWLMECGHLSCASCLGYPNVSTLDTTQQYRCPIPSCEGFQSAVYELNGQIPLHPAIQEFFETPDSITQRLESVLTFQNRQMRLRIKNLHKLVARQRQTMRQNQSTLAVLPTLKQQIHDLKRELNHWRSLQQRQLSGQSQTTTTQGPVNSHQINPSSKTSNLRPVVADQDQQIPNGLMSNRPGLTPVNSRNRHQRTWPIPHHHPILPPPSPAILNHQPRTSNPYNVSTSAKLPRTSSLGTNSEPSRNDLRSSEFGVNRRSSSDQAGNRIATVGAQGSGPHGYDRRLQAIPEDEDESVKNQMPLRRVSNRSEPVSNARIHTRRASNQRPHGTTRPAKVQPMPIPGPSRLPSSTRAHRQPAPNQNPVVYPSNAPTHHRTPRRDPSALSSLINPSPRFIYQDQNPIHSNIDNPTHIRGEPETNRRFPFNAKRSATDSTQNHQRGNPKRRLDSFPNP